MNYLDIMFILIAGVFIAIGIFKGFVKTIRLSFRDHIFFCSPDPCKADRRSACGTDILRSGAAEYNRIFQ